VNKKAHASNRLTAIERRCEHAEQGRQALAEALLELREQRDGLEWRLRRAECRGRLYGIAATAAVVGALLFSPGERTATAQGPPPSLPELTARVAALEQKTQYMRVSNGEMYIENTNLNIRNGLNATNGNPMNPFDPAAATTNGKGNLIIGYNIGLLQGNDRNGSHCLILGDGHDYTSYGGIVSGFVNDIRAAYACVTGGTGNIAEGTYAAVTGGAQNTASGNVASVSGGQANTANSQATAVSGGFGCTASGERSSVSGGNSRTASGDFDWRAGALVQDF
jgi:hypothetical protein